MSRELLLHCEFEVECPQDWDSLRLMNKEDAFTKRFCDVCQKEVMFINSEEELEYANEHRVCVAIPVQRIKDYWKKLKNRKENLRKKSF